MTEGYNADSKATDDAPAAPTRGYIDGCFDIMHSGHYNAIRQAKCICNTLVVGIHSDAEIEENKALPVMKECERYALLEHIKWIDEILQDVPYSPELATLERARADFCIHGDDMPVNSQGVCAYDEMRLAGRLRIVKRTEGVSTTDMIGRLLTLSRQHHNPPKPSSPTSGYRVGAEDAIKQLTGTMPSSPLQGWSIAPGTAGKPGFNLECEDDMCATASEAACTSLVDSLVAKYGMSADDEALLRAKVRVAEDRSTPKSPDRKDSDVGVRAKAPVQLLASTRRLVEFASSKQPMEGDKVVYVSGSFDMFHIGHAQLLKDAAALGTFLLVGIHEDLTVRQSKGPSFPVMNLTERVLNVCACKWVDEVIIGAPRGVTEDLIKTWDIDVVARGIKHQRNESCLKDKGDHYSIPKQRNIFVEVPSMWPDLCHDTIVERIMTSRQSYLKRNADRAKREDVYYAKKSENLKDLKELL